VIGPGRRLPLRRGPLARFGILLGALALVGLAAADVRFLQTHRTLSVGLAVLVAAGSVLPVALAVRSPAVAWRVGYPMLFLGTVYHVPGAEPWPWAPVQIIGFLLVMVGLALFEDLAVVAWATGCTALVPFLYVEPGRAFGIAVLLVAISLLGDVVARRRHTRRELVAQTELTELERARRAVLEERARIAREMHDVVAHHMSMIAVQAETAPFRLPDLPEPALDELAGIATGARQALADMRRLLGVLRAETDEAMLAPQPGLAELPALVETARRAGISVTYTADRLGPVPEAVGLAAYRIAQEALANAARHAPGGAVLVTLHGHPERLELVVRNAPGTTAAAPAAGRGHGLTGMRERAELLGGRLVAAGDPLGGYAVEASLPYAVPG
jgi:signal transduction histidine kinase